MANSSWAADRFFASGRRARRCRQDRWCACAIKAGLGPGNSQPRFIDLPIDHDILEIGVLGQLDLIVLAGQAALQRNTSSPSTASGEPTSGSAAAGTVVGR